MADIKKGIKTSEFWIATLTAPIIAIIVAALSLLGIDVGTETVATLIAPAIIYIFGRGWIKKESEKAKTTPDA